MLKLVLAPEFLSDKALFLIAVRLAKKLIKQSQAVGRSAGEKHLFGVQFISK